MFGTKSKFRQFCPTKFYHRFLISPYNSQEKYVLTWDFYDNHVFRISDKIKLSLRFSPVHSLVCIWMRGLPILCQVLRRPVSSGDRSIICWFWNKTISTVFLYQHRLLVDFPQIGNCASVWKNGFDYKGNVHYGVCLILAAIQHEINFDRPWISSFAGFAKFRSLGIRENVAWDWVWCFTNYAYPRRSKLN